MGSELVFVRCSLPFTVSAPRYCSPSTPVDKAGPQIAVSSISRARVGYGIAPMLDNEPFDAKWACMKSENAGRSWPRFEKADELFCDPLHTLSRLSWQDGGLAVSRKVPEVGANFWGQVQRDNIEVSAYNFLKF